MTLSADTERSIAKTAQQYDSLPYGSRPYPQSQPGWVGGIARIFGLAAAPVRASRVLELGCSSGGNLMPLAVQFPDAEFVGLDVSPRQIEEGQQRIGKIGIKNFRLLCKSLTDFGAEHGEFDYIICHGVFSWVPPEVQESIFNLVKQRLAPEGIAFVSYNVLPGWRRLQVLRDAFLSALPDGLEGEEKVRAAIELAGFLREANGTDGVYATSIEAWLKTYASMRASYLGHEFLEDFNQPLTFREFAERAIGHGLGFLGEAEFRGMVAHHHFRPQVVTEIDKRSGGNLLIAEQLIDLISGRTFRQSLIVHEEHLRKARRVLTPECLDGLHLLGSRNTTLQEVDGMTKVQIDGKETYAVKNEAVRRALYKFLANYPSSCQIADLIEKESEALDVKKGFYGMVTAGGATVSTEPVAVANTPAEKPKASKMALHDAEAGLPLTTNLRHEAVELQPASIVLVRNMKGEMTQAQITDALVDEINAGSITFHKDDQQPMTRDEATVVVRERAPMIFEALAKSAILVG